MTDTTDVQLPITLNQVYLGFLGLHIHCPMIWRDELEYHSVLEMIEVVRKDRNDYDRHWKEVQPPGKIVLHSVEKITETDVQLLFRAASLTTDASGFSNVTKDLHRMLNMKGLDGLDDFNFYPSKMAVIDCLRAMGYCTGYGTLEPHELVEIGWVFIPE